MSQRSAGSCTRCTRANAFPSYVFQLRPSFQGIMRVPKLKRDNFVSIGLLSDLILMWLKTKQKNLSKFETKMVIWRPVEMTWSGNIFRHNLFSNVKNKWKIFSNFCGLLRKLVKSYLLKMNVLFKYISIRKLQIITVQKSNEFLGDSSSSKLGRPTQTW